MTCEEFRELMGDHLGDELVTEIREEFETHRTWCQSCDGFLESYTYTVKITKKLPQCRTLPADVETRLRERLKDFLGRAQ
jgi:hypothetical protein